MNVTRGALFAIAMLGGMLSGCTFVEPLQELPPPAPPVRPLVDGAAMADHWYRQWADQPDRFDGSEVRSFLVNFFVPGATGRRGEPTLDSGYLFQVVLLGSSGRPVEATGTIRAVLVLLPTPQTALPLTAWEIGPKESAKRYRLARFLKGYLVELAWPGNPKTPGRYMLIVRWESADGSKYAKEIYEFQDDFDYERPMPQLPG